MFADHIEIQLKDGTPFIFRPLQPDDEVGIKAGFEQLSPQTRYLRFLTPVCQLPESHFKCISETDNVNKVGWCAIDISNGHETGVGLARYERYANEPNKAEYAITIVDAYQNRGIGSYLFKLLIQTALKNGITSLIGFVLEENKTMINVLKHYNIKTERDHGCLLRIEIDLTSVDQDELLISSASPMTV